MNISNNNIVDVQEEEPRRRKIPMLAILRSKAVWAIFIGHFAGDWGFAIELRLDKAWLF